MAKRGSNIYKRKDGRFEGRVPVGYQENGKIKYRSVYARTLSEVKEKNVGDVRDQAESACFLDKIDCSGSC
ncbi:MAG: hypothetical protein NC093_08770 [Alistipes sp.]|nr:hypothetical protein [Alistipes sp.]